ncbi:MAG: molybdenum cofactor guanylyltransferase [Candidatus Eremiobacterota bacterium]
MTEQIINTEPCTAIVLAGGKSNRMGTDKALLPIRGTTLIETIINQIKDLFSEIIISASEKGKYEFLNYRVITDERQGEGPLMAILSCLRASKNRINFVTACDTPDMNIDFLKKLLYEGKTFDIAVPKYKDGRYEALLAVYTKNIIPVIEEELQKKSRKISRIFSKCKMKYIEMDNETWYKNLNTMEDYSSYTG